MHFYRTYHNFNNWSATFINYEGNKVEVIEQILVYQVTMCKFKNPKCNTIEKFCVEAVIKDTGEWV